VQSLKEEIWKSDVRQIEVQLCTIFAGVTATLDGKFKLMMNDTEISVAEDGEARPLVCSSYVSTSQNRFSIFAFL
jgi:hypothetical protein